MAMFELVRIGSEPGERCNRDGCPGTMAVVLDGECACHIRPPCPACEGATLQCSECGADGH